MAKSNINECYEELISSMAERAYDNIKDGGYGDDSEFIWQAIDDELIYYADQGYVLAMAICRGYISWYKEVNWDEITEMLYSDVQEEIDYLKEKDEKGDD